ncbi:MAG: mechanosensitive ion channel family protein [Salibacteraceae bacterium]
MDSFTELIEKEFYSNTIGSWAISLILVFGAVILARIIYWFLNRVVSRVTEKTSSRMDDIILHSSKEPIVFIVALLASWYGLQRLNFSQEMDELFNAVYYFLISIGVTWLLARVLDSLVENYLVPLAEKTESDFDNQLLPIVQKGTRSIIWILGIIVALNNAGYNVSAIIAGMGIGGLAFAMAAKDTISNIFGGFTIFTDKPFKINDRIKISGFDGTVVEIGLRSTRLRTLENRIVTIPNSQFTGGLVENVSVEPTRKVILNLGLIYDTTPEQMQKAIDLLTEIHDGIPELHANKSIGFTDFGDFSLGITYIYFINKGEDILGVKTKLNLRILSEFNKNGLEMAFPTQTIYTKP